MKTAMEQLERMEALVREMASRERTGFGYVSLDPAFAEAREIVAELPAPVDPDLIVVREAVGAAVPHMTQGSKNIIKGDYDDTPSIKVPLAMLKRGRELEREGK